jgi:hypothetical protein
MKRKVNHWVYFISYWFTEGPSSRTFGFGNCELKVRTPIHNWADIQSARDIIRDNIGNEFVTIINFQLLREEIVEVEE